MKILYLGHENNKTFFSFLSKFGLVTFHKKKIKLVKLINFEWIISYGYRHIIDEFSINHSMNPIINLHISYLPFNRGAHPNYWSFKENTPKGVSIHFMNSGIDTGPILIQKECFFSDNETLLSSYNKLKLEIENLFYENFEKIIKGKIIPKPQNNKGTYHSKNQLPSKIDWNEFVKNI
tara:strand:- start:576 stop:1109 length:534 start_codon:yes stop_codon:yes gene_type:complete